MLGEVTLWARTTKRFIRSVHEELERRKDMAITQQSMIVGVFQDSAQAEQAVAELKQAGFSNDQIEFAGHGAAKSGGLFAGIKSLFKGGDAGTSNVYDDLVGMGMPSEDARYYQGEYEGGRSIVGVSGEDGESRLQEASTILTRYGAYGANSGSTVQTAANETAVAGAAPQETTADTQGTRNVQLREEQLRAYTRPVQTGEVRLGKQVVAEQQTVDVPVMREEVYVERHPVSGQVSDTPIGEGETIRVPVREEQVTVSKQTVETGEVAVSKRKVQKTQQVSDTVRKEKAHVEREGNVPIHDTRTDPYHPSQTDVEKLLDE